MISSIRSDADSTAIFDYLPYFRLGFSSQLLLVIAFTLWLNNIWNDGLCIPAAHERSG